MVGAVASYLNANNCSPQHRNNNNVRNGFFPFTTEKKSLYVPVLLKLFCTLNVIYEF